MRAVYVVATVFLTFQVSCVVQAFLHRYTGHRPLFRSIYRGHAGSHHRLYRVDDFEQPTYRDDEDSVSHTFVPAALALALAGWLLLPLDLFLANAACLVLSYLAHIHVHAQFHVTGSPLNRFGWFRRLKALHRQHHADPRTNFGVLGFAYDAAARTLVDPRRASP